MPINRNANLRYRTLDSCLRNKGRKYTFKELLELVNDALSNADGDTSGVQTRQLRMDLAFMKSPEGFGAPIEHFQESRKHYYHYTDKSFSINNQPINQSEVEQLSAALTMLSRFEGAPQFEWLSEMMPLLRNTFGLEEPERKVISNETNVYYSGFDKITPIFNAIVNKRVLNIKYKPHHEEEMEFDFHPHYLKQYNNRWFAFGYNANTPDALIHLADIWNIALDRIEHITEQSDTYRENTINWDEDFFSEIIGVTRNEGEVEEVKLWFSAAQAPYIASKSLHSSQRPPEVHEDGSITIRIFVIPNYELETLILGFGDKVKVLAPESLREKIGQRIENCYKSIFSS